ncbi:fork head family transcription factor [Scheffersomyces amazonensis]|uniref:fork head family transcription factor n=1 Tax=Scheffersomyces amazonensis TaxID=1078765 RepID=UPI00315C5870
MSTTSSKLTTSTRFPLHEQSLNNDNPSNNMKVIDTPISHKSNYKSKMSTPPESIFVNRKRPLGMETPIKHMIHDPTNINLDPTILSSNSMSLLLSPAFSSPSQHHQNNNIHLNNDYNNHINNNINTTSLKPPASYIKPGNSFLSTTKEDPNKSSTTKKVKKAKPSKETTFDLQSEDKPPYSYATLIGISILSHEDKRLTLSSIYQWISDTFKYYKREDVGWQNSIRHNLSLNKAFVKGEKSKDGKGHFWLIKPGCEEQFLKSRSVKKSSYHEVMDQIKNANHYWNRDDTKRSMNAIPSSPNISTDYEDQSIKRRKYSEIDKSADYDDEEEYKYAYVDEDSNKRSHEGSNADDEQDDDDEADITHVLQPHHTAIEENPFGNVTKTPKTNTHAPTFVVSESPDKPLLAGKNLTYTSSFSCNSNLELSPVRPSETGPLLEPLTPANDIYQRQKNQQPNFIQTTTHNNLQAFSQSLLPVLYQRPSLINNHISQIQPPNNNASGTTSTTSTTTNILQKTPKGTTTRTPIRLLRTPQNNSIMKKLWNSPSYLDDFYYSPLVHNQSGNGVPNSTSRTYHHSLTSYDDDDMILRNYDHHHHTITSASSPLVRRSNSASVIDTGRNLYNDLKQMESLKSKPSIDKSSPTTEPDDS